MSNSFCRLLTNGYSLRLEANGSLLASPCCFYRKQSFDDYLASSHQRSQITDWPANCRSCQEMEMSGQQSLRQAGPDWISDIDSYDPVMMEINLDIKCNAACVICTPNASSLWVQENKKVYNLQQIKIPDSQQIDSAIDRICSKLNLEKLTYVKFYGGEPLFTDTHLKFLQRIPNPQQVTVHYTTNGSIPLHTNVRQEWEKFKSIIFAASLDGVEEQFDYIRWPLPWAKVSENLIKIKNLSIPNILFRVEFTANFLNAYYYDRLETWVQNNFSSNSFGDPTEINLHSCWGSEFELKFMPDSVRELIYKKYDSNSVIYCMVKNLPQQGSLTQWKKFVNIWDKHRKNDWRVAFPDLVDFIDYE